MVQNTDNLCIVLHFDSSIDVICRCAVFNRCQTECSFIFYEPQTLKNTTKNVADLEQIDSFFFTEKQLPDGYYPV